MKNEENEKISNKNNEEQRDLNTSLTSLALSEVPSDLIIQTNLIYGKKSSAYKAVLREYSKKTSVHGLNYIFAIHRPFYEKLYWIIFTVISLYLAISYMWETYIKWLDTPTILGFDETLVKIHKIPFPTVTICPENKRDITKFDFSDVSEFIWSEIEQHKKFPDKEVLTEEYVHKFLATLQTCNQEVINRFSPFLPTNINVDVAENLLNMVADINVTMQMCKWNGRFDEGCSIIRKVLTDEGVCYQFNGLRPQDIYRQSDFISYKDEEADKFNNTHNWSLDYGYQDQGFNAYPKRSIMSSVRNGFYALLGAYEDDNDYVCNRFKQGFKVFLNSPDSVPVTTGNYILVPNSHEVMVTVLPQYITSLDNLLQFGPEKRQCYFNSERNLYFFKFYTQNNCQTECLTNYTIAKCGCAKFWMPKPLDVPVCDLTKVNCYNNAANELEIIIANQTAQKVKDSNVKIMCDCMPACNSLEYNYEITRAYLDAEATTIAHRENYEEDGAITSRVTVYYRESQFTAIKRTVLYDLTQLIANCGGIFGLFMGISMLSVIEFIYFFSLRLLNNFRKRKLIQKKLEELEMEIPNCS
ncbi:pickpocket protein 28-like [Lucilia sericata]|uniref:pickpocket protein 28-like n=1 Tax=Lucilia sericata TaxID=13632 RepID=UPI0018A7ED0A|nr:pickpocket protein 28-like [Lucilia sericata]